MELQIIKKFIHGLKTILGISHSMRMMTSLLYLVLIIPLLLSSSPFSSFSGFEGQNSGDDAQWYRRESGYQNNSGGQYHSLMLFKLKKADNSFQYIVNNTTGGVQTWLITL